MHSHQRRRAVRWLARAIVISSWFVIWPVASTRFVIGTRFLGKWVPQASRVSHHPWGRLCVDLARMFLDHLRDTLMTQLDRRQSTQANAVNG